MCRSEYRGGFRRGLLMSHGTDSVRTNLAGSVRWGQSCIACLPSGRWPHGKDAGPSFPLASLPHASQGCGPGLEARTEEQAGYELVLCAGSLCLASSSVSP